MITFYPHFLSCLQAGRGWKATAGPCGTDMVLQPVLSLEAALAEEPWSLQLCFCCLMLPAGSQEHPDLWVQMGKERSCPSPPDATSLWEPSFPPLLRRGSSTCDYDEAGEVGSRVRPHPLCAATGSSRSSTLIPLCFSCHCSGRN